jgi:hypothetical protein
MRQILDMNRIVTFAALLLLAVGCATNRIDWRSRVGNYTYDEAILELGPPESSATTTDGTRVGDWLTSRGRSTGGSYFISRGYMVHHFPDAEGPDYYLRLTFDPQGRLTAFKQVLK